MKYNQADIILFPHCYLTEGELNKTLETFERLRICLPWYMEPPEALSKTKTDSRVTILYPPENLKPDGNFLPLLSEYRFWMNENVGARLAFRRRNSRRMKPPGTSGRPSGPKKKTVLKH